MGASAAFFAFCAAVGFLSFLYALDFRRRAMVLGTEGLRSAMARLVDAEGAEREEALREGTLDLLSRFRRALYLAGAAFFLLASSCVALAVLRLWPQARLALCGLCVFLAFLILSLLALRKLPATLLAELEGKGNGQPSRER